MAEKVVVGFSGGVDSLAAASLLRRQGLEVQLVALQLDAGAAAAASFRRRVDRAAASLALPVEIVDLTAAFRREVVSYLQESYRCGATPNPCIRCNARIKFPALRQAMARHGAGSLATGHYVRRFRRRGSWLLAPGADREKDQSYFLQAVAPETVAMARFPLSRCRKTEVLVLAADLGFDLRGYRESQELCFVNHGSYADLVAAPAAADGGGEGGLIVNRAGEVLGRHRGIHHYTVGQRRGLGIAHSEPLYVLAIEPDRNRLVVGERRQLYRREFFVRDLNWFIPPEECPSRLLVQIRHRHRPAPAVVTRRADGTVAVAFAEPQFAVTPGQGAAFYDREGLVAGGWIA